MAINNVVFAAADSQVLKNKIEFSFKVCDKKDFVDSDGILDMGHVKIGTAEAINHPLDDNRVLVIRLKCIAEDGILAVGDNVTDAAMRFIDLANDESLDLKYGNIFLYTMEWNENTIETDEDGMTNGYLYNPFTGDDIGVWANFYGVITKDTAMEMYNNTRKTFYQYGYIKAEEKSLDAIQNIHDNICIKEYYKFTDKDKVENDLDPNHGTMIVDLNKLLKVEFSSTMDSTYIKGYLKELLANLKDEELIQIRIYQEIGTILIDDLLEQLKDYKIPEDLLEFRNQGNPPYIDENGKYIEDSSDK